MGEGSLSQEDIYALLNGRYYYPSPSFEDAIEAMSSNPPLEEDMIGISHLSQDELDHLFPGEPMPLDILEDENDSDGEPRIEDVIRYSPQYVVEPSGFWQSVLNVEYPPEAIAASGWASEGIRFESTIVEEAEDALRTAFARLGIGKRKEVTKDSRMKCLGDK